MAQFLLTFSTRVTQRICPPLLLTLHPSGLGFSGRTISDELLNHLIHHRPQTDPHEIQEVLIFNEPHPDSNGVYGRNITAEFNQVLRPLAQEHAAKA